MNDHASSSADIQRSIDRLLLALLVVFGVLAFFTIEELPREWLHGLF